MDFKRTQGLKKDSDFRKVYKHGKSFANRNLVMYILDNKSDSTRVGISVSKKSGGRTNSSCLWHPLNHRVAYAGKRFSSPPLGCGGACRPPSLSYQ